MATVKTHDLIRCNKLYETLPSVNETDIYAYNGSIVRFDDDNSKTFTVLKNVQGRFYHPSIPSESDDVEYSVTSMKVNGIEQLLATATLYLILDDVEFTSFPNYTVGNEYSYTSNEANGVTVGIDTTGVLGLGINNFYKFIDSLIEFYGINVNISRSPDLWWSNNSFPRLNNFILEKRYNDNFEFTVSEKTIDTGTLVETIRELRFVFDGGTVAEYIDGVLCASPATPNTQLPQYSETYSFFSYSYAHTSVEEINSCPIYSPFSASLQNDLCSSLTVNCDCTKITFGDNSNYDNGLPGHDSELFTSRIITIHKPNGGTYVYATADYTGADEVIPAHYSSSNAFVYNFQQGDVDGIYEIELCTYPDWNEAVTYELFIGAIVKRNGKLYKVTATNTNADPSLSANSAYWAEYSCVGNCNDTRYCTKEKVVVLCLSLLKCYKTLVKQAFCGIDTNPCKPICDNKQFMNAMKFKVVMDELEFSVCSKDWISAQAQIDILNSLCCCNG